MQQALEELAVAQGGVFATRQAMLCGETDQSLTALGRAGEVVRVRQGAYVLGPAMRTATPEQRLALRARAVLSGLASHVAPSHQSALAVQGLPLEGMHARVTEVIDVIDRVAKVRLRAGLRRHPMVDVPVVEHDGIRVVSAAFALVQVAARDGARAAVVSADAAVHSGLCTVDDIVDVVGSWQGRDPQRVLRLPDLIDGKSESPGETRTRLLLWNLGFSPRSQVEVKDRQDNVVGRVDFMVGERVVVEYDGKDKYPRDPVALAAFVRAEKRRADRLRELGYIVIRLETEHLGQPQQVARRIRAALAEVG